MPSGVEQFPGISALIGRLGPKRMPVDMARFKRKYYSRQPDVGDPKQLIGFGTSGQDVPPGASVGRDGARKLVSRCPPKLIRLTCLSSALAMAAPGPAQPGKERPMNVPGSVIRKLAPARKRAPAVRQGVSGSGDYTRFSNYSASFQLLSLEAAS